MQKTKIEWCDYTINPVKGLCPMACSYCYARAMYKRFRWDGTIRLDASAIHGIHSIKTPSRIFVGSTMELFGEWIPEEYYDYIWGMVKAKPQHTFIFLTKQPQNLSKWEFPDNCWVGVSATDKMQFLSGIYHLINLEASIKFVSFEPLLETMSGGLYPIEEHLQNGGINWAIIGAQSPYSMKTFPKWEWVKEIIESCDKAKIPVFLKENLGLPKYSCEGATPYYKKLPSGTMGLRQEMPYA